MTIAARHGHVRARQRETRAPMFRNGVRAAMEVRNRVAVFAPVIIRRCRELVVVRILVTIRAQRELHFVDRIPARRDVTLRAIHLDVLAL